MIKAKHNSGPKKNKTDNVQKRINAKRKRREEEERKKYNFLNVENKENKKNLLQKKSEKHVYIG